MAKSTTREAVKSILEVIKKKHYKDPTQVSDAMAMGILMAHYFDWDGLQILKATYEGLEDSNFHTVNETIDELIKKVEQSV